MENVAKKHKSVDTVDDENYQKFKVRLERKEFYHLEPQTGSMAKYRLCKGEALLAIFLENITGFKDYQILFHDCHHGLRCFSANTLEFTKYETLDTAVKVSAPGKYPAFQSMRSKGVIPLYAIPPELLDPNLPNYGEPDLYYGRSVTDHTKAVFDNLRGPVDIHIIINAPVFSSDITKRPGVMFQVMENI